MDPEQPLRLGDILLSWGIIDEAKLNEALKEQKDSPLRLGEILVSKGYADEQQIAEALAQEYRLPIVSLATTVPDVQAAQLIPVELLKKYNVIPLKLEGDTLVIATDDPLNMAAFQDLRNISGHRIKAVIATSRDISGFLKKNFSMLSNARKEMDQLLSDKGKVPEEADPSLQELELAAQEAPVVKLVNSIIFDAIDQKTSDIHFEPMKDNLRVRFRVDGVLYERMTVPQDLQAALISRVKIISGMDIAERRKPQDGRIGLSKDGSEFDIRVSTLPDIFGEKIVLRLLDKKNVLLSLHALGMDEEELDRMKSLIYQPYGMILVTGPTGSGKTTTLYTILNMLNDESRNIITVEDPVEYEIDGINQTAINVRAGYTFATAIRHILRQDPDVVMIGEIRDLETAEIAIQAALTGHLVLSTLHTNSASGAITRLLDMNVEPFLIGSAVIGVIAQRLVRKLCPECKEIYSPPQEIKEKIAKYVAQSGNMELARPAGCDKCRKIGYSGRQGIYEILMTDEEIRQLVLQRAHEPDIAKAAVAKGMNTLQMAGINKALKKVTSFEEVLRVTFMERT